MCKALTIYVGANYASSRRHFSLTSIISSPPPAGMGSAMDVLILGYNEDVPSK